MSPTVRFIARRPGDLAAAVDYPDGSSVVVRWHAKPHAPQWRCARCGRQRRPTCPHAEAVHLALTGHDKLTTERNLP